MYVCVCKAITEKDIKNAACQGATSVKSLYQQLDVGSQCGKCLVFARQVLNTELAKQLSYNAAAS